MREISSTSPIHGFTIGEVCVDPARNLIGENEEAVSIEPRIMDVLCELARNSGEVCHRQALIENIWDVMHGGDESLTRAISILRQALQKAGGATDYIETIPKRGYRLTRTVIVDDDAPTVPGAPRPSKLSGGAAGHLEGKLRIAVLPFRSLAEPDDQGFFADGIVDELITTLGQMQGILVAGRTSSFQFKNSDKSLREIAAALNVTHILSGSVQRHHEQVRISTSLTDIESGFEIWAYSYDGDFDHIFETRKEMGQAVNDGIAEAIGFGEASPKVRSLSDNREAYGLYLQGRALTIRAIGEGVMDKAVHLLGKALDIDPDFPECWVALAEAEINLTVYTPCLNRLERAAQAAEYAKRAIALDPAQGHARIVLAFYEWTQNNIVGALDLAFEAYALEPNNPDVLNRVGSFLLYIGRTRDALPYIEASIDQDPVNGRAYVMLTVAYINMGDLDRAVVAGQRMVDLGFPSMWLAQALAAKGDTDQAVEVYQKTRLLMNTVIFAPAGSTPMTPEAMDAYWLMAAKGVWSGDPGHRQVYRQVIEMLHTTLADPADSTIVLPAMWMGDAQMVFKSIGQQITPANFFGLMHLWDDYEPGRQIRLHPDFMDFAQSIGFVDAWKKYGWPDLLPMADAQEIPPSTLQMKPGNGDIHPEIEKISKINS